MHGSRGTFSSSRIFVLVSLTMSTSAVLFVSLVLDLLAFTLILPLMPSILDYYARHDESGVYSSLKAGVTGFSEWIHSPGEYERVLFGGMIGSWFSLLQFLATPFVGAVSDVVGRKIPLLICLSGVAASYALWAVAGKSFLLFCVSRTMGGLCKGNISIATAVVTDVSGHKERGKGMALIGIAFSVGFIVGPMLGAILSNLTSHSSAFFALPALVALSLSLLNLLFTGIRFQESLQPRDRADSLAKGFRDAVDFVNPVALFSFRSVSAIGSKERWLLRQTGWIYFHFLFLYSGLEFTLCFLTHLHFNYTSMQQGKMFLFMGTVMALTQGGLVRRIAPGKELLYALITLSLIIPSFLLIGSAYSALQLYIGLFMYSISSATIVPCLTTLASSFGPKEHKGATLGIFRSIGSLARAFGPLAASTVFWKVGPFACYFGGAILLFVPLMQLRSLRRQMQAKAD